MRKLLITTALLVNLLWQSEAMAQECTYGSYLGEYKTVTAYCNGSPAGNPAGDFQCVDYVKRFYLEIFHFSIGSWGNGGNYFFTGPQYGLTPYAQNGDISPQPDDILCFSGGGFGHVAIITSVGPSEITVIEQNWSLYSAFRTLPLTVSGGKYNVHSGSSSYSVQGWLRFGPGGFKDGWHEDGSSQAFRDCYNLHRISEQLTYPFSDAGNPVYVHPWGQTRYLGQNYKTATAGECYIMRDPESTGQAFLIKGGFWNVYRFNFGPLRNMGDGTRLGCPITDEYQKDNLTRQDYENGYMTWNSETREVHVCRQDGTKINLNEYDKVAISAGPVLAPQSQAIIEVKPLTFTPATNVYLQDFEVIAETPDNNLIVTRVTAGENHVFQTVGLDSSGQPIALSAEARITVPEAGESLKFNVTEISATSIDIAWSCSGYFPVYYEAFINGNGQGRIYGALSWSFVNLRPETSYTIQIIGYTADMLELAKSNVGYVTTLSGDLPPLPPPPPPPLPNPEIKFEIIEGIRLLEPAPYLCDGVYTAFFKARYTGTTTQAIDRFQVTATCQDMWGSIYVKNFATVSFVPAKIFSPGEIFTYQGTNDGWALPGLATTNTLKAYVKINGVAGQYQVTNQIPGALAEYSFITVDPATLKSQLLLKSCQIMPEIITADDIVSVSPEIANDGTVPARNFAVELTVDQQSVIWNVNEINPGQSLKLSPAELDPLDFGKAQLSIVIDTGKVVEVFDRALCFATVTLEVLEGKKANLTITSIDCRPQNPTADDFVTTDISVANLGDKESASSSLEFRINGVLDSALPLPLLLPSEIFNNSLNFGQLPSGNYVISVSADPQSAISESDETDNFARCDITVSEPARPNLSVTISGINPAQPSGTDPVTVLLTVQNLGSAPAIANTFEIKTNGTVIYAGTIPELGLKDSYAESVNIGCLVSGDNFLSVAADTKNIVDESDENDNEAAAVITVIDLLGNLHPFGLYVSPTELTTASEILLGCQVINDGTSAVGPAAICFMVLTPMGQYQSNAVEIPVLEISQSCSVQIPLEPAWVMAGSYRFYAAADPSDKVAESDEDDNITASLAFDIGFAPDLLITSVSFAPEQPKVGDSLSAYVIVSNAKQGISADCRVSVSGSGLLLTQLLTPLAFHESATLTFELGTMDGPGEFVWLACADSNDEIPEEDEYNNTALATITVTEPNPALPNLIPAGLSVWPDQPTTKTGFEATMFVSNTEQTPVPSTLLKATLKNPRGLTYQADLTLEPIIGQGIASVKYFFHPKKIAPGVYTLSFEADPFNTVTESNENDNISPPYFINVIRERR
ncbi:CHAP domain-containing protein [Candidatus Parcubacteria bacterium]|nr:MAG: CHAP domain-containing protein [Candidatus Parcubacteria bacterium]